MPQRTEGTQTTPTATFGSSLAFDGGTLVVGSPASGALLNPRVSTFLPGATPGAWDLEQELNWAGGSSFGHALDIEGDTLVVGAPELTSLTNGGYARIYTRSGSTWSFASSVTAAAPTASAAFGFSVSLSNDTLAVGAIRSDDVHVFTESGGQWTLQAELQGPGGITSQYGFDVAVDGDTLFVGNPNYGTVHVFERSGGTWTLTQDLGVTLGFPASYGHSVDLDGDWAVVGAPYVGTGGQAYLYRRDVNPPHAFQLVATLEATNPSPFDDFGDSVALDESFRSEDLVFNPTLNCQNVSPAVVVGCPGRDPQGVSDAGSIHVFIEQAGSWVQAQELWSAPTVTPGNLGWSVAIGDGVLFGGAPFDDGQATNTGAVTSYVTTPNQCIYGTGKLSSGGCTPSMRYVEGVPSVAAPNPSFVVTAENILPNKTGWLSYTDQGEILAPLFGGTLYLQTPLKRSLPVVSGPLSCAAGNTITIDIGTELQTAGIVVPGGTVNLQWFMRDPADPFGISLSNALQLTVTP